MLPRVEVELKELGYAQVWWGEDVGVLFEGVVSKAAGAAYRRSLMTLLWGTLEAFLNAQGVTRAVTLAQDPEFDRRWYREFLSAWGFRAERSGAWAEQAWQKELS